MKNIDLGYTDTESFVTHVKADDIYEDLNELDVYMDFQTIRKTIQIMMLHIKKTWLFQR